MGHQCQVQGMGVRQLPDRLEAQRGNPAQARVLFKGVDLGLREGAAIPHQNHPLQAEAGAQLGHLVWDRRRIRGIPAIHFHGDRPAVAIRQHAVDNARGALLLVPIVAKPCQGTGGTLVIAAGHVVQHVAPHDANAVWPASVRCALGVRAANPWRHTGRLRWPSPRPIPRPRWSYATAG